MFNRWVRFLFAVAAITAAIVAAFRVVNIESRLSEDTLRTQVAALAAETALTTLPEIRAALHAYVAPGQGLQFWVARTAMLNDKLRGTLLELDPHATAAGVALTEALDVCDRLAAAEQRIRQHVRQDQALLAGDIIFEESRDLLDTVRLQVARARDQLSLASGRRLVEARKEQTWLLGGAAGVLALAVLLLVPVPSPRVVPAAAAETVREPAVPHPPSRDVDAPRRALAVSPVEQSAPASQHAGTDAPGQIGAEAPRPLALTPDLASLCGDLARMTDSNQLPELMARAATLLDASGVIIWLKSPDGQTLFPAAASGYPDTLLARIGSLSRDASNLTARAFREGTARTVDRAEGAAAAVAAPLVGPDGPVGVLSAELKTDAAAEPTRAAAAIIAAQLATLFGSMPGIDAASTRVG